MNMDWIDSAHTDVHRNKRVVITKVTMPDDKPLRWVEKRFYKDCPIYKSGNRVSAMARAARDNIDEVILKTLQATA